MDEGWAKTLVSVGPGALPELGSGEVQVYWLRATGEPDQMALAMSLLSAEERERASRYLVGRARVEFAVGRAALRMLVGAALGVEPSAVAIGADRYGKPVVGGVEFNVSHSRGLICIALCRETPLGVDVEWVDAGLEVMELAEPNFAADETLRLALLPAGLERATAFCRIWTQKEAVSKADGRGLWIALADIALPEILPGLASVPCEVHAESVVTRQELPAGSMTYRIFQVVELEAAAGYAAALSFGDSSSPTVCRLFLFDFGSSGILLA